MDVKFDICFTSPLTQGKTDCRLCAGRQRYSCDTEDKRIQEIDFGVLEGTQL